MNAPLSRLPHLLFASTLALSAAAVTAEPAPRDPASGLPTGKRMHKPYTVTAQSAVCSAPAAGGPASMTSDPEEGGQVAAHAVDATNVRPLTATSDPEEGGQVARTAKPKPKPSVGDMTVTKRSDSASPGLAQAAPAGGAGGCPAGQH